MAVAWKPPGENASELCRLPLWNSKSRKGLSQDATPETDLCAKGSPRTVASPMFWDRSQKRN